MQFLAEKIRHFSDIDSVKRFNYQTSLSCSRKKINEAPIFWLFSEWLFPGMPSFNRRISNVEKRPGKGIHTFFEMLYVFSGNIGKVVFIRFHDFIAARLGTVDEALFSCFHMGKDNNGPNIKKSEGTS